MYRPIKNILFYFSFLLLWNCSDDNFITDKGNDDVNEGIPVELNVLLENNFETRGVEDSKKEFNPGDVIHVEATFYDAEEKIVGHQYKPFQLNSTGSWDQVGGISMKWPGTSIKGTFKAYYINKFQETLNYGDNPKILNLSDIEDNTDPLYAEKSGEWGQKIHLNFSHMCTHLTFKGLEPDIADYFWLLNKKSDVVFHNAFQLSLLPSNVIEAKFIAVEDTTYINNNLTANPGTGGTQKKGLVYIQRRSENILKEGEKTSSKVQFYLEPGDYSDIELRTINNYPYLTYKSEETSNLLNNIPYIINILKNKGITFVEEEDKWDDDLDAVVEIVRPEEFLQSIVSGTDYILEVEESNGEKKEITIIKNTSNGSYLCRNVSFNYNWEYAKNFTFEMPVGKYFDGGNHFISELATNLFESNQGVIQHLGLKKVRCNVELFEFNADDSRNSQWGLICRVNNGVIDNVRVDDLEITYNIAEGRDNSGFNFDLGSVVGYNNRIITNMTFGDVKISSEFQTDQTDQKDMKCTLNLGGLIGQSLGTLKNIKPINQSSTIEVKPVMEGEMAVLYVGGIAGFSANDISDITIPMVNVDVSGSKGMVGNTGGIVGRLRSSSGTIVMSSCTVSGSVSGMPVESNSTHLTAYSYTGGLAGYVNNFDVVDCRSLCDVELKMDDNIDNSVLATGGGFGRILSSDSAIKRNYIWANQITGPSDFIGNFCGIAPSSRNWVYYEESQNVARDLLSGKFVGASIDDNSGK